MKIASLFKSRKESLTIDMALEDVKNLLDENEKKFHFRWQSKDSFIISLKFSFGSNLLFDTNYNNTKSDIIANGELSQLTETKTKILLETKSKYFLGALVLILPMIILLLQQLLKMPFIVFIIALLIFPLFSFVMLYLVQMEENKLIRLFKESLNHRTKEKVISI